MIEFNATDLSKKYGNFYALKDFNLEINKGECVALLGPNGAGKSTLLKIATNIIHPTSGTMQIEGINVQDDPMRALEKVGPLVELPEFYPYLNGYEILNFVCKVKGASKETIKDETARLSTMLKMDEFINRKSGSYSRGMKQRMALACAMALDPELLILDEPTFGLDPRGMREFIDIIVDINKKKNKTIIMSTHLISEAREIASRVIIMNHGKKMVDMKNERDISLMKVTFSGSLDSNALSYAGIEVVENGTDWATITAKNDESNKDIILKLVNLGMEVKWVEPVNSIEKTYLDIVE